jgi:hypothetical protein
MKPSLTLFLSRDVESRTVGRIIAERSLRLGVETNTLGNQWPLK